MKFLTQYDKQDRFYTCPGSPIKDVYALVYDDNGCQELVKKGEENIYDKIQASADSVDIHVIMKKFENGDTSVLNKTKGFFGDISEIPDNFVDIMQIISDSKTFFDSLPVEERAKYNFDLGQFLAAADKERSSESAKTEVEVQENVQVDNNKIEE